jgi:flagellar basal body-associated protein FliL
VVAVTELLFIVLLVLIVVLAVAGLFAVTGPDESERQRYARQAREAERQIAEIGRRAQAAILAEALKRAQPRSSDHMTGEQESFPYGPWDD